MALPPPRLVVFDLGGVLVRICRSWREAADAAGVPFREAVEDPRGLARRREAVRAYDVGALDAASFPVALSAALDGLYAPEEIHRIHDAWILGEYAGVPALFDALDALDAARGVSTGLLSNTNDAHWRRMVPGAGLPSREFPSLHRVAHPHASHRLGVAKPDRAIFERFEAATGHRGPEIVFFDDLPENVAAARAAGWVAEVVDSAGDPPRQALEHLRALGVL